MFAPYASLVRRCTLKPLELLVESAWSQRLKLNRDELPSNFAFNFKLRRYALLHAQTRESLAGGSLTTSTRP